MIKFFKETGQKFLSIMNKLFSSGFLEIQNFSKYKKSFIVSWCISLFSIIFFVWAAFAQLDTVVRADGFVIPKTVKP